MRHPRLFAVALLGLVAAPLAAQVRLNGAGATFPNIIYQTWILTYNQKFDNVEINYQSIGSGGGIQQMTAKTFDFGCSDGPMNDEQLEKARATLDARLLGLELRALALLGNPD